MKRFYLLASMMAAVFLSTSYAPPTHALPKYGWELRYYTGAQYCGDAIELGHDIRRCDGARDVSGTLDGPYKYSYMIECSSHVVEDDGWYFYCPTTGPWMSVGGPCGAVPC
jgi:uncharacterized protein YchJ